MIDFSTDAEKISTHLFTVLTISVIFYLTKCTHTL